MTQSLVERLRSTAALPLCPYDRRSPDYWTTDDTAPCKVCGQLNDVDAPNLCRGADTRIMEEAANEIEAYRVGQGANAYTAEGKETRDDILPLPPTEGETLTPDVKEIVERLEALRYPAGLARLASQALLRLAGELEAARRERAEALENSAAWRTKAHDAESSRTQAEGKMKGYGRQTIDDPQHCTGGGE